MLPQVLEPSPCHGIPAVQCAINTLLPPILLPTQATILARLVNALLASWHGAAAAWGRARFLSLALLLLDETRDSLSLG